MREGPMLMSSLPEQHRLELGSKEAKHAGDATESEQQAERRAAQSV